MVAHNITQPDTVKNDSANDKDYNANIVMDIMTGGALDPNDPNNREAYVDNLLNTANIQNAHDLTVLHGMGTNGGVRDEVIIQNLAIDKDGGASNTMQAIANMFDDLNNKFTGSNESDASTGHRKSINDEHGANDANAKIIAAAEGDEWSEDEHLNLVAKDRDIVADPSMGVAGFLFALHDWNNDPSNEYIDPALAEKIIQNNTDVGAIHKLTDMLENAGMPGVKEYGDNLMTQLANSGNQEAFEILDVARTMELEAQKAELALNNPEQENNNVLNNIAPQQPMGMRMG